VVSLSLNKHSARARQGESDASQGEGNRLANIMIYYYSER
jgi:hypothetical protein